MSGAQNSLTAGTPLLMQDAQTATGPGRTLQIAGRSQNVTLVVQCAGTISTGIITVEEAYYPLDGSAPYAGTWSNALGGTTTIDLTALTGGAQQHYHFQNYSIWALRARISTAVTGSGGSVTVWGWAN